MSNTTQYGKWMVEKTEDTHKDWDYYSKGWHRTHGPKKTICNRRLIFTRPWGRGQRHLMWRTDSWRGDYMATAILELGLSPKHSKAPMKVRLHKAYDASIVERGVGYTIYERTVLGGRHDYCIVDADGTTYHSWKRGALRERLALKKEQHQVKMSYCITFKALLEGGFCEAGIRSAAQALGLDIDRAYSLVNIAKAVRANKEAAKPFLNELHQIGV
ncbi:MAG TPA: hypothetical protein ENI67_04765 [Gammaproteobacteria bacterium]|nr:hypothetical protein [Gammaproteobacteria bacterium]